MKLRNALSTVLSSWATLNWVPSLQDPALFVAHWGPQTLTGWPSAFQEQAMMGSSKLAASL